MLGLIFCVLMVIIHGSCGNFEVNTSCSFNSCPDHGEVDFFQLYTNINKQEELINMSLNEAPRVGSFDYLQPSFEFSGEQSLEDSGSKMLKSLICGMCSRHSFTFHASIFFVASDEGGPLLVLQHQVATVLSIDLVFNGNLIVVHYMHRRKLVAETFKGKFIAGTWYKIALHFDGNMVRFFIDCNLVENRAIPFPDYCFDENNFSMLVGRNLHSMKYTGSLQSVRVLSTSSSNPMLKQCPNITSKQVQCPVCGFHLTALKVLNDKMKVNKELKSELENATVEAQNCSALKVKEKATCMIDSVRYNHGDFAKTRDDEICFCQYGEPQCIDPDSLSAAPLPTHIVVSSMGPSPTPLAIEEPTEAASCGTTKVGTTTITLQENETDYTLSNMGDVCIQSQCKRLAIGLQYDSHDFSCSSVNGSCDALMNADGEQQMLAVCCRKCDACSFAQCPPHSICSNKGQGYNCECSSGFEKKGDGCYDINECNIKTDNCPINSSCVNTEGSFKCMCPEFYELGGSSSEPECVDIDECSDNTYNCQEDTICVNRLNGYSCQCKDGYQFIDNICKPTCDPECQFGDCISPNNCSCFEGYQGPLCEKDVDECYTTKDLCLLKNEANEIINISTCVNTFGGYFCTCDHGYQWVHNRDGSTRCSSVHECSVGIHHCPVNTTCVDRDVGYQCDCPSGNCADKCILPHAIHGQEFMNEGEFRMVGCDLCTCNNQEYSCVRAPCDCSDPNVDLTCCPLCAKKNEFCFGRDGLILKLNDRHYDSVNSCSYVTCVKQAESRSLQLSEPETVQCDTLNCPANKQYTPEGACCPVCALPICSSSINVSSIDIHTHNAGCETCSCYNESWSCHICQSSCPPLDNCPAELTTYLSSNDNCPFCISSYNSNLCNS